VKADGGWFLLKTSGRTSAFLPHQVAAERAMSAPTPHFLLFSASEPGEARDSAGDWRFVLEAIDGSAKIEVADSEPEIRGERLELLAVVRGLEALEQPSRVTLLTPSRYVSRGLSYGLNDWRENDWQWERHGAMVPVKNHDLWQRVDRALEFHRVECRQWRLDAGHEQAAASDSRRNGASLMRIDAGEVGSAAKASDGPGVRCHRAPHATFARPADLQPEPTSFRSQRGSHRIRPRLLVWRRSAGVLLGKLWLQLRQIGAPLFRAPWLD
jgi:ribonuclease HI